MRFIITLLTILSLTVTANAHWADMTIQNCEELQILDTTNIAPDEPADITTLSNMFSKAFNKTITSQQPNITRQELADFIKTELQIDLETIFKNYPDGQFHPDNILTNAEACTITIRLVKQLNKQPVSEADNTANQVLQNTKLEYPTGTLWGFSDTMGTKYYTDGDDTLNPTSDIGKLNETILNTNTNGLVRYPTNIKYACGGFAAMISDRIFGKTNHPCHEVFDTNKIHLGDTVYFTDHEGYAVHIAVVYSIFHINNQTYFQTAGANELEQVRWPDDIEKHFYQISKTVRVFTRHEN